MSDTDSIAHKKICVIGDPIAHSRSPLIHNYWIAKHGLEASYMREHIGIDGFEDFLLALTSRGYHGANITIPHKRAAFHALDHVDDTAAALEAVNTVYIQNDTLCGTNTDGEGFIENLKTGASSWQPRSGPAIILGAGGAARAIVHALLNQGVEEIVVVNRTRERAEALADKFKAQITISVWDDLAGAMANAALLVNTTALGMTGKPALELDLTSLNREAIVCDIVYAPLETALIRQAKARGHIAIGGLGMLLHQAVRGFELWFGIRPAVTAELIGLVTDDLTRTE